MAIYRADTVLIMLTKSQIAPSFVQIVAIIAEPITAVDINAVPKNSASNFRISAI